MPPAEEKRAARTDPSLRRELSACQEKLAERTKARATSSDAAAAPDGAQQDASERPATVEALEGELKSCKKSRRLVNAEVCSAAAGQFDALLALPKDGLLCGPKSRAADLIERNFEHCDDFADSAAGGISEDLTKEEASLMAEAIRVQRAYPDQEVRRRLKEFVFTCTETPPKYPPGVNSSRRLERGTDERTPPKP
jgi:hypothetical protein